ncbi:fumarylacetoacetate hydrolase family protein [Streptomyces sp. J2-1]|uniref:fumarylacetoacetate hydrolase family protein n=1 Tax=Streptomyces corallincola TaxID=2851888 RepID=UPI001C390B20|nr:fumarylacetoacetate hydrolase family protein [Streptomyces corallincola]MBV2354026.1 fumarylacetoacetate hydrolase family protein [Streptomyces corallincola]
MRIGNLAGRLTLFTGDAPVRAVDVEKESGGRFAADPQAVFAHWDDFLAWAAGADTAGAAEFDAADLGAPAPAPEQVFAIGINYAEHAAESRFDRPDRFPPVFTKFRSSLSGPVTTVRLPDGGRTDWEVELVVVVGRTARNVPAARAWEYVAGLTVGQDLSERELQLSGPAPQFSLGKSYPGFAPTGPWLVTPDEFADPAVLRLGCAVNGEQVQDGTTADLLFPVAELIEGLSAVLPLHPGDLIFTGTPAGVGLGRSPQRFLAPGDVLTSRIEGIGELRQSFVTG